jgi:hypothetical protein
VSAERRNVPAIVEAATPTLRSSLAVPAVPETGDAVVGSQSSVTTWVCEATAPWTKASIWSLPKPSITFSRAPRLAGVDFDRAGDQHLTNRSATRPSTRSSAVMGANCLTFLRG